MGHISGMEGAFKMLLLLGNASGWADPNSPEHMILMNFPLLVFAVSFVVLLLAAFLGDAIRSRVHALNEEERDDFYVVLNATLTLLGLLIGFSFSMAISRYDQRKNYEEAEANAIGTEYVRADLLPDTSRSKVQAQLLQYLDLRIKRYEAHASHDTTELAANTGRIQVDMWREARTAALANPTPTPV